jgi:hypothetical protein
MALSGVFMRGDRVRESMRAVHELTRKRVLIGIPAEKDSRADGGDFGNAAIGYLNEFGSPASNVPPRPHLIPGVKKAMPQTRRFMLKAANIMLDGALAGRSYAQTENLIDVQLSKAGLAAVASVQQVIQAGVPPPLKHRKGVPLIDTGDYWRSITYVIDRLPRMRKPLPPLKPVRTGHADRLEGPT